MDNTERSNKKWLGAGILAALAASLCCITPILAILGGLGGVASAFSWLEPFRPYLIALTVIVLGVAWYKTVKPKSADVDCDCEEETKGRFINSKSFLLIITLISALLLAFPYYSGIFVPKQETKKVLIVNEKNLVKMKFSINDMACSACEGHINHNISELEGVLNVETSYKQKESVVLFDTTKTKVKDIEKAVDETGYTVSEYKKTE
ncbi:putative mercuric transport protein [hydrothermal vent metagenome]|uniref:Putative mercuric transport protein n=1 Tax=hydrothermal vent metagenome TaxID=652676 RepID=A0A3B0UTE9_9ZZZZ